MINIIKKNGIYKLVIIFLIVYSTYILINQQAKLNSYITEIEYCTNKIETLKEKKEYLLSVKENVNSTEYIEEVAREKLDMYLPNERVYIDISK